MNLRLHHISLLLADFDLQVNAEINTLRAGIFGPSGAGKTSLLEIIAGWRKPARGKVSFGETIFDDSSAGLHLPLRARQIGYVSQDDTLFPHLSVRGNLLYGKPSPQAAESPPFDDVIDFLQITHLLARDVRALSRGEKQRVTIGRTLLTGPRLLLLDEPLTGLDAKLKEAVAEQLAKLPEHFAVPLLYVTHDPKEAIAMCDEVLLLNAGQITAQGPPADLLG